MKIKKYVSHQTRISVFVFLTLFGCVTVNVNFPESTVQKATDDYVKELYRAKRKGSETPTTSMNWFIPSAFAEEGTFQIFTAKTGEIQKKQAARLDEIIKFKKAGNLGETNDGMLIVKELDPSQKLLKSKIEKLVKEENSDREKLYEEVMEANKMPENRLKSVKQSFGRSFQSESPSSTWLQDTDGKWSKKN